MPVPDLTGATWRKSSRSAGGADNCVQVTTGNTATPWAALRDSKDPDGPALVFPARAFAAFLTAVKSDGCRPGTRPPSPANRQSSDDSSNGYGRPGAMASHISRRSRSSQFVSSSVQSSL